MAFFDRFKKKNNIAKGVNNRATKEQLPFDVKYSQESNGNLQVDFYDKNSDFEKFYDTTRLIIEKYPLNMEGYQVYNCAVSWYGQNDCQMCDKKTGKIDSLRAQQYRGVLIELNSELLIHDQNYCNILMKRLLDKQIVEKYLENGLQENPEQLCGKYIGGVVKTEKGYAKIFNKTVGKASHNSPLMIKRRQEYRMMIEKRRQKDVENKREQIEKLQNEIDGMEK